MSKTIAAGVVAFVLATGAAGLWQVSRATDFQFFGALVDRVETDRPVVALTFDDGPSSEFTAEILAMLDAHGARATFFVTGRETMENMDEARAIVAAGHELGNHSWHHQRMVLMTPQAVRDEIERTDAAIRAAGHEGEIHFRPPYGKKLLVLPWYLWRTGRTSVTWDIAPDSDDPSATAAAIAERAVTAARPGSIILLHLMYQSRAASREVLPAIIRGLRAKGLEPVPLSQLLAGD